MTRDSQKIPKQLQKLTRGRIAQLLHKSKPRSAPGFHPDKISRAPLFSLSSLTRA